MRTGYPCAFTEAGHWHGGLAAYLLLKELCAEQGRGFFRVLAVQLKIAILGKADQRVRVSLFDRLVLPKFCNGQRRKHLCFFCIRQSVTAAFLLGQHFRQSIRVLRERLVGLYTAMLTDQSHCCIEAAAAGCVQHKAICEGQPVMIRRNRVLRYICRLFPVVDLKDISEDLAALDGFRDDDAGNALVVGLFRIETEGVVIPCPLNEDLIFTQAVRSVRTAEPHQRLFFGIWAFGSAADDALVDVEVFLVAVYMTVHELLQLRNDVNICVFLHASPFSQLHVMRFGFDRRFLLRLLFCGSFELIADGGLFLLLLLLDVFQRRHQLTVTALCFPRRMTAMDFEQRLTVLRDRVAFDPDAVPRQQIEGMVRGAIGRPHSVVVIGNLPLERVHDGGFDFLLFRSQAVRLRCLRCFLRHGGNGRLDIHGFYLNRGNLIVLPCNDLRVSFLRFLRSSFLLGFGLLTERIHEKCRQSGIGFIHKEAGGILRTDINALCPFLEGLRNTPVKVFLLNGVCEDIPDALRRKLLKDAFYGGIRIQPVISVVGADRRFNRSAAFHVCGERSTI